MQSVQLYPHFGLHAAMPNLTGYGFAHVHPGTAWTWLRNTEGLGATLDQFLEMVSGSGSRKLLISVLALGVKDMVWVQASGGGIIGTYSGCFSLARPYIE